MQECEGVEYIQMNWLRWIMTFPEHERIIYAKNPLDRVICQLKFPTILKIETDTPSEFQDLVRKEFPGYEPKHDHQIKVHGIINEINSETSEVLEKSTSKRHMFTSLDKNWQISLAKNFVALTCFNYERWEVFKERLDFVTEKVIQIYEPAIYTRVGLRYIDVFNRSNIGLEKYEWNDLLEPYVLGLLSEPKLGSTISACGSAYEMPLDNGYGSVRIATSFVNHLETSEICYMVDSDFWMENLQLERIDEQLEYFHIEASRLIQWMIKDKLHRAMEPESL